MLKVAVLSPIALAALFPPTTAELAAPVPLADVAQLGADGSSDGSFTFTLEGHCQRIGGLCFLGAENTFALFRC